MTSKKLLSSSVNEILGIYSPGGAPTIKETSGISLDITLAHEEGHRELCDTSSLGQYMKLLAFVTDLGKTPELKKAARGALSETVEQCWTVQEGYATRKQMSYCHGLNRPEVTRHVWENLPASYINAFNQFPSDIETLKRNINLAFPGSADAQRAVLRIGYYYDAYVIARAAMSFPLAQVLINARSLPSYEASIAIRRQSPDVRLKALAGKLTPAFTWKCLTLVLQATLEVEKVGTPRPLDELLDRLAREVCQDAGLTYEPSYAIDINELQYKWEGGLNLKALDGRDLARDATESYEYNMNVVGKGDLSQLPPIPVENAVYGHNDIISRMFGNSKPHVVCELGARTETGGTVAWLHLYATRDEVVKHLKQTREHEKAGIVAANHPNSAQLLLIFPLNILAAAVPKLIEWFAHRSWAWVLADALLEKNIWSLAELRETGEVFAISLGIASRNERRIKSPYALPQAAEVADATRARLGYLESVPESAVLLEFEGDPALPGARLVRLAAIDYLRNRDLKIATFEDACVAETLLQGFYSTHLLSQALKGTSDESTDS